MKKMLCSFIIAAAALNTLTVYAQDTEQTGSTGKFEAVIAASVKEDGTGKEGGEDDNTSKPVNSVYELEKTDGLSSAIDEKTKNQVLTRDMLMQKIYELEGEPDVPVSGIVGIRYFGSSNEKAAIWSYYNKIMYGYGDEQFGKGDYATREQLAAMLFRYAGDRNVPNLLLDFEDSDEISEWAEDSMRWAVSEGILEADNNMIKPKDAATVYDLNNALKILGLE